MLIAAGSGVQESNEPVVSKLLGKQPLRWIGDVSYGFYLWHWPLLILGRAYFGHRLGVATSLGLIVAALVLAWLSYVLLENPIRRAKGLARRERLALLLWPAAVGCLVAVYAGANLYIDHQRTVLATAASKVDISKISPAERAPRDGNPVHNALADALDRATLHAPLTVPTNLATSIGPWLEDPSCGASETQSQSRICSMGDVNGTRRMVVLGDSHILMWLPALNLIAQRHGYELIPITKLGCTPYEVVAWKFDAHAPYTQCNQWRSWALQQVKAADPDVIVVASATAIRSVDPSSGKLMIGHRARRAWRDGAESLANQLTAMAPQVEFLQDINRLPFKPSVCLSNLDNTAADCTFKKSKWVTRGNRLVREGIRGTGVRYVRLRDLFCEQARCPTVVNGLDVYGDGNHITPAYAKFVGKDLGRRLRLPN